MKLFAVEPQSPERVAGIGSTRGDQLARGGIETLTELALSSPDVIRVLTGAQLDTAATWHATAFDYFTAYNRLTGVSNVRVAEAEAFAEVMMRSDRTFADVSDLAALTADDFQAMLDDLLGSVTGHPDPAGYVASGGTEANIYAVRIARAHADDTNVVAPTRLFCQHTRDRRG